MKMFKKSTISLAMTAALLGGLATAQFASAAPVMNTGNDKSGDILLFPYYTVENGFKTLVHLVNSSNTDTTIAKVRMRDYKHSQDVLDFTVILSPNDVFSGSIRPDGAGNPVFTRSSDDTTCTSPLAPSRTFTPFAVNDYGKSGHVEVITMATIPHDIDGGTYPALAEVVAGSTHLTTTGDTPTTGSTCATVDSYFDLNNDDSRTITNLQEELSTWNENDNGEVNSNLFGHFTILNQTSGVQGGGRPTTIAGALGGALTLASPCDETSGGFGLTNTTTICAQVPTKGHFTFPHLLHVAGVDAADGTVAAANVTAFKAFENSIAAIGMANEWSNNADNGVKAEMIFTLPSKYVNADNYPAAISASHADWTNKIRTTSKNTFLDATYDFATPETSKWDDVDLALNPTYGVYNDATGCMNYGTVAYDREEQVYMPAGTGTSTSGGQEDATDPGKDICNEVTAISFGAGNPEGVTQLVDSDVVFGVNTDNLDQNFGWLRVYAQDQDSTPGSASVPMIGYTMWSRTFGSDLSDHYGHVMNNIKL